MGMNLECQHNHPLLARTIYIETEPSKGIGINGRCEKDIS